MSTVFDHLPSRLFFPLASVHREHYAALLLIYYRLFLEYHSGVERELVVAAFDDYFRSLGSIPGPEEESPDDGIELDDPKYTGAGSGSDVSAGAETPARVDRGDTREVASGFLRRLIEYGWMNEEEQQDFARIINISSYATPFFEALYRVDQGIAVEYESHVIGIYSSLVGDAARDHGEHAVINAHGHAR
ncbi:MAG: hypothetical protein EA426_00795, partial [Spirochaetaceae bacterium]